MPEPLKVKFKVTEQDGTIHEQEIAPPTPEVTLMQIVMMTFAQYAQIGMIRKVSEDHFTLLPANRIKWAEAEIPTLAVASLLDIQQVNQQQGQARSTHQFGSAEERTSAT